MLLYSKISTMASTFQQFAQRVERLASEWQELNAELQDTDAKTEKTQEKVQKLKVQRGEICADLDEIEKKQKVTASIRSSFVNDTKTTPNSL